MSREDRLNVLNTMFIIFLFHESACLKAKLTRAHVNGDLRGAFKAVVNTETKEILGATIFSENLKKLATSLQLRWTTRFPTLTLPNKSSLTQLWLKT